ncbi:MAG TPA: HAD hydrolase family protein [Phycisphaerales bacterium]|nr:HAD hydrolase family protein [Phycisphaerales bacterium]
MLCLDVDGVLTDGSISIDDHGREIKRFHVRDGTGLRLWRALGHEVAVITGRRGAALRHRLCELSIRHVVQGSQSKGEAFEALLEELELAADHVAMLGDDLPDLPILRACGYPMAVGDAAAEVRAVARFTTVRPGGHGAVREAIEHLLREQRRWDEALELFD